MPPASHSDPRNVDRQGNPAVADGEPSPLAMVYGGGASFGIAYGAGVAKGLADSGIPVETAPALGTSAGSWVASAVALGLEYEDFDELSTPRVPTRERGVLHRIAAQAFGAETTHPLVSASAVYLRSRRRHILDGGRYPLADIVAASSAVPALFPPHRIDGRLYIDGGMWSATSIDAAAEADEVIVVAPIGGRVNGVVGRGAEYLLRRELRSWRERHPGKRITLIRPNRTIAAYAGRHPLALFNDERARAVYPLAYDQGREWGEKLQSTTEAVA